VVAPLESLLKFLVDENLSPALVQDLYSAGFDATSVRDRGRLGVSDQQVWRWAFEEDRIVVTANIADFERLASSSEIHCGVIFLADGQPTRAEGAKLMAAALDVLKQECAGGRQFVNRVLYVWLDGTHSIQELPAGT
jgi:predicted nuclease of predicted toxin-antitoxin system